MENGNKSDQVVAPQKDSRSDTERKVGMMSGQSNYRKIVVVIIVVILLLLGLVTTLNFMLTGSVLQAKSCTYEGLEFASGSEIKIDGCNSCSCTNGEIQCTTIACEENGGVSTDQVDTTRADVYSLICGSFEEPFSADVSLNIPDEMFVSEVAFLDEGIGQDCYVRLNYLNSMIEIGLTPGNRVPVELIEELQVKSFETTDLYITKVADSSQICERFEIESSCTGYLSVFAELESDKYFEGILGVNDIEGDITGLARIAISEADSGKKEQILEKFSELISGSKIDSL